MTAEISGLVSWVGPVETRSPVRAVTVFDIVIMSGAVQRVGSHGFDLHGVECDLVCRRARGSGDDGDTFDALGVPDRPLE